MAIWLSLSVLAEAAIFDVSSQFLQFLVLANVPNPIAVPPEWLGLSVPGILPGATVLRVALTLFVLLALRVLLIGARDAAADRMSLETVREIRSRLFRETHRTSGALIAPEIADQTIALFQRSAVEYGKAVAARHLADDQAIGRLAVAFAIAATIRLDFAVIFASGALLTWMLHRSVSEAIAVEAVDQAEESERLRNRLREELREAYQGRSIGSEIGQERPSESCLTRLEARDENFAANWRRLSSARRWGQVAIAGLVLLCLAMRTASERPSAAETVSLLSLGCLGCAVTILDRTSRITDTTPKPTSGLAMIGPVHQALTGSARIWDAGNAQVMQPCRKALTIEGISLPGQSPDATHPRTLEARIPARRVTAVVCPDGAYRLKLMRLMARWEDPEIGRILIDGADLRDFSIASTRLQIGSIRAEAYVNNGSVIENIALDDPRADLLNVIEAAKAVHAHRMIQRLPQGYDTYIDSEKQPKDQAYLRFLIALARGKWHDPSILMVEEPALPMTRGMKELLRDAYRRLAQDRTVVLFTRHASSVLSADQVIMIGKARVIVGEPRNLLATHKGFRRAMAEMGLGLRPKAKSDSRSRVAKASVKTTPPPAAI